MSPLVTVAVSLFNALAAIAPQIPGFIQSIRASSELSAEGRALLDSMEARIDEHVKNLDKAKPLPVPP